MNSDNGFNIGNLYRISKDKKLGSGAFGEIYQGIDIKTNNDVAVKMELKKPNYSQLKYETKILKYLKGATGIPDVHYYTEIGDYNFMVMDILGPSLEDLFNLCDKKFSLKTALMLAEQMISRIEFIHTKNIIHRDIKPDNFLIGLGKKKHLLYIIDFGLAKRYIDSNNGKHIPYKDGKSLTGTARYTSIYTHMGVEQSRRDDLESLLYVMMYFIRGGLPWQGIKAKSKEDKYMKIKVKKISSTPDELCKGYPEEFVKFFYYCRGLYFEQKPDYDYLRNLLKVIIERFDYEFDFIYDWSFIKQLDKNQIKDSNDNQPNNIFNKKIDIEINNI